VRHFLIVLALVGSACGAGGSGSASDPSSGGAAPSAANERLELIAEAVDAWAKSESLEEARAFAETAANLVVGPGGLGYGDRDGNGVVAGDTEAGFLPGPNGQPAGVVLDTLGSAPCVERDVLGGSWEDPTNRWLILSQAIEEWAPRNNTFPSLPSHPMRVVGWATLTQSGTFEEAIEYSGHADLHVDISRNAMAEC